MPAMSWQRKGTGVNTTTTEVDVAKVISGQNITIRVRAKSTWRARIALAAVGAACRFSRWVGVGVRLDTDGAIFRERQRRIAEIQSRREYTE